MISTSRIIRLALVGFGALFLACTDGPTGPAREAQVVMSFLTPATVRTVVVSVSGPGISPALVVNISVGADSTARDTLTLTAGAGRRFEITALDSSGVTTHHADTTVTLQAGANPLLQLRLIPLDANLGVTVTFGGSSVTVVDTTTRVLLVGDTLRIAASGRDAFGDALAAAALTWGVSNPAVATVSGGLLTARRVGQASVVVSYRGAAVRIPVEVVQILPEVVVDLQTGGPYSCVRRQNATVWCWGQLPTGSYLATPTQLTPGTRWLEFSAGYSMMCGITTERLAYCWGNNRFGQLGGGVEPADVNITAPQIVAGGHRWSEIVSAHYAACGTTYPDRRVYCWGGVGTTLTLEGPLQRPASLEPVEVAGTALRALTVGASGLCGLGVPDGQPYCIGDFSAEYLTGTTLISGPEPVARTFAVGQSIACSVTTSSAAYCFGNVNGTTATRAAPINVGTGIQWSRFFGGNTKHYCGIDTEGTGYCWGANALGQVGDGSTTNRPTPFALPRRWIQLAPGLGSYGPGNRDHTCGLTVDREVYCWGEGEWGQLGNGNRASSLTPVRVNLDG